MVIVNICKDRWFVRRSYHTPPSTILRKYIFYAAVGNVQNNFMSLFISWSRNLHVSNPAGEGTWAATVIIILSSRPPSLCYLTEFSSLHPI